MSVESVTEFLRRIAISNEMWEASGCDLPLLTAIGKDFEARQQELGDTAELLAKVVQAIPHVHSVRWRVKDLNHLLAKIVRKRAEGVEKYKEICVDNYGDIVTDLVGVRALHLFKEDYAAIDADLRMRLTPIETPVAYIRSGDQRTSTEGVQAPDIEVKTHPQGYRSVHYVVQSRPLKRNVVAEIQVRTIFEEGWSEIDHLVRYPTLANHELVPYFLGIFNRLSGSADEMGSFVRNLSDKMREMQTRVAGAEAALEKTLKQMESFEKRDKESTAQIARLRQDLDRFKQASAITDGWRELTLGVTKMLAGAASVPQDRQAQMLGALPNTGGTGVALKAAKTTAGPAKK